jgi:hypothetical protein
MSAVELAVTLLLLLGAAILFGNSQYCWFNRTSCGMWEPLLAVYTLAIACPLLLAGIFRRMQMSTAAAVAYIPAIIVIVVLVGQAWNWW